MPVHDWTLVEAGIFHAFHTSWIPEISKVLNAGLLPQGLYALLEQHAGRSIADILTLHGNGASDAPPLAFPPDISAAGTAVAEVPPRVRYRETIDHSLLTRRRTLAIRHVNAHRLIAIIEILSQANKDRKSAVDKFAAKAVEVLDAGIHVMLVDLFPPGPNDPQGMHGVIRRRLGVADEDYDFPADEPLTLASYSAGPVVNIYSDHLAVGSILPDMPLFFLPERYVNVPLEATYQEAYRGMPAFWREVLEGRRGAG